MRVPSKVANRGSAGNAARTLEPRIPNAFRKRKIERAPSANAQVREALLFEVRGDGTAQTVERYNAHWTHNRLPLVRRSAEGKGRNATVAIRKRSAGSRLRIPLTTHSLVDGPSDVMDGLRCIFYRRMACHERRVGGRRYGRETHRDRCAKCRLRGQSRPTLCRIGPNLVE